MRKKTARQIAAARRNIKKAQARSAQLRRKGKSKPKSKARKYAKRAAIGIGVLGVLGGAAGYKTVYKPLDKAFNPGKYNSQTGRRKNSLIDRTRLATRYAGKHRRRNRPRAFLRGMVIH